MSGLLIYRRAHGDSRAKLSTTEEARSEVRGTPLYPWVWIAMLYDDQPVVTESSVYGLRRDIAEQPIPAPVAGSTLGGETEMDNVSDQTTTSHTARFAGLLYDERVQEALSGYLEARSQAEVLVKLPVGGSDLWEQTQARENTAFALLDAAIAGAAGAILQAA